MKLARYWTRARGQAQSPSGEAFEVFARGWSDEGIEAARRVAQERAQKLASRLANDPASRRDYDYDDAPVPEALVDDLRGNPSPAVVTRNSYGCLVLNAGELLFADIDDGQQALQRIARVVERRGLSARVYQTAAGYRVMVTDRNFRGGGDEAEQLLNELGSDPMYMRLCRVQESFRARLTPKPWRCEFYRPQVKFPFETPDAQRRIERWLKEYNAIIPRYATCRFVQTIGAERVQPAFASLVEYHDRETRANSRLTLA